MIFLGSVFNSMTQDITFSDPNFEKGVLEHDSIIDVNLDGKIQMSEANGVKRLKLRQNNINSIQDIYFFPNVVEVDVALNEIAEISLDGLKYLYEINAHTNKIKTVSVKNLPNLYDISIHENEMTSDFYQ